MCLVGHLPVSSQGFHPCKQRGLMLEGSRFFVVAPRCLCPAGTVCSGCVHSVFSLILAESILLSSLLPEKVSRRRNSNPRDHFFSRTQFWPLSQSKAGCSLMINTAFFHVFVPTTLNASFETQRPYPLQTGSSGSVLVISLPGPCDVFCSPLGNRVPVRFW